MVVQIIGLPCTGKTTLIKKYIKRNPGIKYIDFANFNGRTKNKDCIFAVKESSKNIILESACGLDIKESIVVLYKQPMNLIYNRHKKRGDTLDEDYLSLLLTQMAKPKFTVTTQKAINSVLDSLFY